MRKCVWNDATCIDGPPYQMNSEKKMCSSGLRVSGKLGITFPQNLLKYGNKVPKCIGFTEGSKWCTMKAEKTLAHTR